MIAMIVVNDTNAMTAATIAARNATGGQIIALPRTMSVPAMTTGVMPVRRGGTAMIATGGVDTTISATIAVAGQDTGTHRAMAIIM